MFSMLGAGEDAFRYAIYQVVSVCVWVILYLLSESSDWWLQHVEADALRTGSEDPFPTAALFTGRCNHIPARLPSCNPSTPSYCSTHTQTHTHLNTTSLSPQTWHPSIIHHCKERTENAERGREEELHSSTQLASHHTLHTQHTATNLQTSPSTHWQELKWNREVGWKEKESERERERRTEQTENRDEGETSNSIEISTKCFQVQFSSQSAKKKGKKSPSKCVSVWSQQWKWWSKPHKDKLSFWATHTASPSTIIDHLRTISSGVGWTLELLRGKKWWIKENLWVKLCIFTLSSNRGQSRWCVSYCIVTHRPPNETLTTSLHDNSDPELLSEKSPDIQRFWIQKRLVQINTLKAVNRNATCVFLTFCCRIFHYSLVTMLCLRAGRV